MLQICITGGTLQVIGDEGSHCSVDIHPMTGKIDPGQSEAVSIKATWHQIVRTKFIKNFCIILCLIYVLPLS